MILVCWQMVKTLQSRGVELRPSIHKLALELAAETGDPVRAGQAVSAIRRSGQHLSATAYSRYIIANTKARVGRLALWRIVWLACSTLHAAHRHGSRAVR